MSALRECDFCASPLVVMRGSGTQGMYWTQCGHCHAEGPVCGTEAEALAAVRALAVEVDHIAEVSKMVIAEPPHG